MIITCSYDVNSSAEGAAELVLQGYAQGYGQMQYPYGQGQYGQQDASVTGQQGQTAGGTAPYGAQQQMPYGQMRMFFACFIFTLKYAAMCIILA